MGKKKTTEQFIEEARKVHGDKYDYSKVEYIDRLEKVCIICPKHGEFWQQPRLHLFGNNCRRCVDEEKRLWTYKTCYEAAKKCSTRKEFETRYAGAYNVARKNSWLDDYTWFVEKRKPNRYWNYEMCFLEAKKYETRNEFQRKSSGAYHVARKNSWLDDYTWLIDGRVKLFTDKIDSVYAYEFPDNTAYVGRTLMKLQGERHTKHKRDRVGQYAKSHNLEMPQMKVIEDNLTLEEGLQREDYWVNWYREHGYNVLNKGKTGVGSGALGSMLSGKWNRKTCYEEAKKYKTRCEFRKNSFGAYKRACQKGWIKDYIWPLDNRKPRNFWNRETCYEEAKKSKTRSEFQKTSPRAYNLALQNGWINDYTWFIEKSKPNGYWTYNTCMNEAKKHKTRTEFKKASISAYRVAYKNGWINDYTWLIDDRKNTNKKK